MEEGIKEQTGKDQQLRTTTVLFIEYTKGGSLQKSLRGVVDRLSKLLGFNVRITEKGGTKLESLPSNKELWSGQHCGREVCRTCAQPGDKKEPCKSRNVVYESECSVCNPPGSRKEADKENLGKRRGATKPVCWRDEQVNS